MTGASGANLSNVVSDDRPSCGVRVLAAIEGIPPIADHACQTWKDSGEGYALQMQGAVLIMWTKGLRLPIWGGKPLILRPPNEKFAVRPL